MTFLTHTHTNRKTEGRKPNVNLVEFFIGDVHSKSKSLKGIFVLLQYSIGIAVPNYITTPTVSPTSEWTSMSLTQITHGPCNVTSLQSSTI